MRSERFARGPTVTRRPFPGWSRLGLRRRVAVFSRILSSLRTAREPAGAGHSAVAAGPMCGFWPGSATGRVGLDYSGAEPGACSCRRPGAQGRYSRRRGLRPSLPGRVVRSRRLDRRAPGACRARARARRDRARAATGRGGGDRGAESPGPLSPGAGGSSRNHETALPPRVLAWDPVARSPNGSVATALDLLERDGIYLPRVACRPSTGCLGGDRGGATIDRHPGAGRAGLRHGFLFAARRRAARRERLTLMQRVHRRLWPRRRGSLTRETLVASLLDGLSADHVHLLTSDDGMRAAAHRAAARPGTCACGALGARERHGARGAGLSAADDDSAPTAEPPGAVPPHRCGSVAWTVR